MAAYNRDPLGVSLSPAQLVERLNKEFLRLQNFLGGIRREDTRTLVPADLEVEGKGNGVILTTPDGTKRYRLSVDNAGVVTMTLVP